DAIRGAVRDWAREERLEAYDQAEHKGYLRHLVVREGRNTGQVLVQLVTAAGERFDRDQFVEMLRRFPEVRSIHWAVNETPAEVTNAAFFAGETADALAELRDRAGNPDVIVVDPPRAGLSNKAVRRLGRLEAPRIVYVSCNPTTLAGNVKELAASWGYTLEQVRPVDMFPHTPHVESVSRLVNR